MEKMKTMCRMMLGVAVAGCLAGCGGRVQQAGGGADSLSAESFADSAAAVAADTCVTVVTERHGSCEAGEVKVYMELPSGTDAVSRTIADTLLRVVDLNAGSAGIGGDTRVVPPYKGERDFGKIADYYVAGVLKHFREQAAEIKEDIPDPLPCSYEMGLRKTFETRKYVVFLSQDYWFLGGAHGGIGGEGSLTFSKNTGKILRSFFKPGANMQGILKRGLTTYFGEASGSRMTEQELYDCLLLDGKKIPLPVQSPCPTDKGLVFTYCQYEIAPYAAGMPNFLVTYKEAAPYLTDEAKELLLP